jgi:2-phospho-L-lactate/phosphoenolpyruvate guanylyltransferase
VKTLALIPAKRLVASKTRLTPKLDRMGRQELSLNMLHHVVEQVRLVPEISACGVVSADEQALALAVTLGATAVPEQTGSLNQALNVGREWALQSGAEALLVVLSDLPLVDPDGLAQVVRAGAEARVVIAPSTDGGTNALLLRPPGAIPFRFGRDSARYHRFEAEQRGLRVALVERDSLRFDVDTPDDLAAYQSPNGPLALVRH